jgi:fucose permease
VTEPRERLYALSCAAMFVFGMVLSLPGTVLGQPETVAQFGLTLADRGGLIAALFGGLLVGSLASGPVVDAIGLRVSLTVSVGLVAVCLPLFAAASSGPLAAASLAAIGLASATSNTASNALSSDLFPDERARRLNGVAVMFGLGGLAVPTATVLAAAFVSWRAVVIGGSVLAAGVALAASRVADPPAVQGRLSPIAAFARLRRRPGFAGFCLLILLGGGNEAAMAGWTSSFLVAVGFSAATATWSLAGHWLGLILSRAFFARRVDRIKAAAVERSAAASAVLLVLYLSSSEPAVLLAGPFVVGMAMALVVPTSLALAGERLPGNPGMLFGALLTLAQVGGMAVPAAVGLIAQTAGVRIGLAILVGTCGLIAVTVGRLSTEPSDPFRPSSKDE